MVTFPIFQNFSKNIFSAMFSALQYSSLNYESSVFFYGWFLFYFISTKNEIKKGKYSNGIQIFIFLFGK